ncbi:hypothetical protein HU200_053911 [Digitaria exilis]|uniref:VWFA domain-containing protein n=1 Tax=Digitaria exilis TaxID=1010633 RepID=A0A835E4G7_9POAL|nr:hypothetical protein HU200_053911 [Digitaria exilis]
MGRPLNVVILTAVDGIHTLPNNNTRIDRAIFQFMEEKLSALSADNRLGYLTYWSASNSYCFRYKSMNHSIESNEEKATCTRYMAWCLLWAELLLMEMGKDVPSSKGIILLFSDGKTNTGDFFEGGHVYKSKVPVHTFTLGGDANNNILRTIAQNSQGGEFHHPIPGGAPDKTLLQLTEPMKQVLDSILTKAAGMNKQLKAPVNATAAAALKLKVTAVPIVSALRQDKEVEDLEVLVRVEAPKLPQEVAIKHPPIDLVAVVDVSSSMGWSADPSKNSKKSRMDYLKAALLFIIDELHDDDRLSIVQFSGSVKGSTELSPISGNGRETARQVVRGLVPDGGTVFKPALEKAASILQGRDSKDSSRVPFIVFLSDGEESKGYETNWDQVVNTDDNHGATTDDGIKKLRDTLRKYPVHTFGFSSSHDPEPLLAIARVSRGTYSYIDKGLDNITDAFAVCLGGLTTVVTKNATIALSVTAPGVTIVSIDSGGYNKLIKDHGRSGEVCIPVLYEGEVKNFIAHLHVPRVEAAAAAGEQQMILTAGGTYIDATSASTTTITISQDNQHQVVSIQRPASGDDQQRDEAVLVQVTRFKLLVLLETKLLPKGKELKSKGGEWAQWLRKTWSELKNKNSSNSLSSTFDNDVEVIAGKLEEGSGEAYICSYVSSHQMERATTMGSPGNTTAVDYKTQAITKMEGKAAAQKPPAEAPAAPEQSGAGDILSASDKPHPTAAPAPSVPAAKEEMRALHVVLVIAFDLYSLPDDDKNDRINRVIFRFLQEKLKDNRLGYVHHWVAKNTCTSCIQVLRTISGNSPGGQFHPIPAPDNKFLSERFKKVLESILTNAAMNKKQQEAPVLNATAAAELKLKVTAAPIVSSLRQDKEVEDLEVLVRVEAPQLKVAAKHPPIDLVAVVDVSGSMGNSADPLKNSKMSRMDYLKAALLFIIDELHDDDRLSIVQFSGSVKGSTELSPISGNGRETARQVVRGLVPDGGTVFKPALETAASILQGRDSKDSSRVPFIVFLSDGEESKGYETHWDQVVNTDDNHGATTDDGIKKLRDVLQKYPVHTFGFSSSHDPAPLLAISRVSCGTYSYIDQGLDKITDAFAVCLGGLATVVIKDATIALNAAVPGVTIVGIDSGGYNKAIRDGGASGQVCIPVLYEGEVKNFVVHLHVPRAEAAAAGEEQVILTAGGTYVDATAASTTTITIGQDNHHLAVSIQRPASGDDEQRDEAVLEQVTRFKLLSLLLKELLPKDKELKNEGGKWAKWLREKWSELKNCSGGLSNSFDKDVEVMAGKLAEGSGQAYICSYVSSHQMERATTMGSPENTIAYKTPAVTKMAEKAAAHKPPVEAPAAPGNGGDIVAKPHPAPTAPSDSTAHVASGGGDVAAIAKPHPASAPANNEGAEGDVADNTKPHPAAAPANGGGEGDIADSAKPNPAPPAPSDTPAPVVSGGGHGDIDKKPHPNAPAANGAAGDGDVEKKPLEAPAPENGGRGDIAASAKPHLAPSSTTNGAGGDGDIIAGGANEKIKKPLLPPPEETPWASDELDVIERLVASWSDTQRDLVVSTLGHAQGTCGDQLLKATFLNLTLQSFNQTMYQSVFQAVEQALHLRNCNGGASMAVAASLPATAAAGSHGGSSEDKEQPRCKCVDLSSIGQRMEIWTSLIHQLNQIKLCHFHPSKDATATAEATHYLAVASLEPSMEAINRAMHHDIYLVSTACYL